MTAFGQAMIDSINGTPQVYDMTINGTLIPPQSCQDFLCVRRDERGLIDSIKLPPDGAVMDYGCGAGRFLRLLRDKYPLLHCYGIDNCDELRHYCSKVVSPPATFFHSLEELPPRKYDLIMLMGNGLGILKEELDAVSGLERLVGLLAPDGRVVIETNDMHGQGYSAPIMTISYKGLNDGPFRWGCADRSWITRQMERLGCKVNITPSEAPGGNFFFATGILTRS